MKGQAMKDETNVRREESVRPPDLGRNTAWALEQVEAALRGLQFGQVIVTVQDGVVVQVERTERKRFQKRAE